MSHRLTKEELDAQFDQFLREVCQHYAFCLYIYIDH